MSTAGQTKAASGCMRERWLGGRATYGAWLTSGNAHLAELLARAGFDWVGIDAQHGFCRETGVGELVRVVSCTGTPAFVRTATNTAAEIGWALDAGAAGVIVPMVDDAAQAREAVAACRYAPRGNRSWGPLRPAMLDRDYRTEVGDSSVLCFVMAETLKACESIEEIAAVPGLDGVFVGPSDLAITCGARPSLAVDSASVRERIAEVLAACARAGIVPGIYAGAAEDAVEWARTGFRLIGLLSDSGLVEAGAKRMLGVISAAESVKAVAIAAKPRDQRSEMQTTSEDRVEQFLAGRTIPLYVEGDWRDAQDDATMEVQDPATGERIATVAAAQAADIDAAVQAGARAFPAWSETAPNDRAVILHRLADLIEANVEELARIESLDVGKPVGDARGFDIPFSAEAFRYYADLSVNTRPSEALALKGIEAHQLRVPHGVCGFIVPWNFPFMLLAWGAAPALAAGNTVVVKPAEVTPLSSLFLCELAQQAGVPSGVINVVPGTGEQAGGALAAHPGLKRLAFTGSPEVGRRVAAAAAANLVPVKLELGGKGAAVVFHDVDVAAAAEALAGAITLNAGQVCCTATRWVVQRQIFDRFVDAAGGHLEAVSLGAGTQEATTMGPVVSEVQRRRVLGYVEDGQAQGATILAGGGKASVPGLEGGFFVNPTLLTGAADNVCAREEIFGPVAYVMPFDEEREAIELVNRSEYGLANSVWSADLGRAQRVASRMVAGNSWINAHNVFAYGLPYGGTNLSGFGGGVNGAQTYFDYLRHQTIARPLS